MKKYYSQVSDSLLLSLLLAFVGGFLESYTFFCRGGVFANAQTGNIVFIGISIGSGNYLKAIYYALPVIVFMIGIFLSLNIRKKYQNSLLHWRQIIIVFEMLMMFIIAFIPMNTFDCLVNTIISFICALQVESFRKVDGNFYASTMCTGNIRSGIEHLHKAIHDNDGISLKNARDYFGIVIVFIFGTISSMFCTSILKEKAILLAIGVLFIVFVMMFKNIYH